MDPWAEKDFLEKLVKSRKEQTLIIITHRISTAKYADLIYVMEDGQLRSYDESNQPLFKTAVGG